MQSDEQQIQQLFVMRAQGPPCGRFFKHNS